MMTQLSARMRNRRFSGGRVEVWLLSPLAVSRGSDAKDLGEVDIGMVRGAEKLLFAPASAGNVEDVRGSRWHEEIDSGVAGS